MPEHKRATGVPPLPTVEDAATSSPAVDVEKLRQAQQLLEALRRVGLPPRGYEITSPYERRPLSAWREGGG